MRWIRQYVLLLGVSVAIIVPASAGDQDIPCIYEIRSYCAEVKPGNGRLLQCLKSQATQLSYACSHCVAEVDTLLTGTLAACYADVVDYCFDVHTLGGAESIIQCLRTHQEKVSPPCRKALPAEINKPWQTTPAIMP